MPDGIRVGQIMRVHAGAAESISNVVRRAANRVVSIRSVNDKSCDVRLVNGGAAFTFTVYKYRLEKWCLMEEIDNGIL